MAKSRAKTLLRESVSSGSDVVFAGIRSDDGSLLIKHRAPAPAAAKEVGRKPCSAVDALSDFVLLILK